MKTTSRWLRGTLLADSLLLVAAAAAAETGAARAALEKGDVYQTIGLGAAAAFAVGVSIIGAGYAVAKIGSAALGAAVEKPELLIRSLLFVALAEGLAVLGFAIAMMLIQKM
ncbi:MAG: ATPase [Verrucomicrobia bacterium]|nr:ATPase [Verrucomicrobiota bacterium]OQC68095.1 MAG: V-type ATP synthase subunit K [Verrucomicrobia bacterium ADurb.Bin006]MDI9379477.1 ATP synthase subunit C [Verrucomicrobiota bacterium]HOA62590.1 ATP synthase subunit C [Verrucomicrobiota bacterium]HOF49834.1 ATP synthase subunit C [Verrucomicrobiota bacterium]